MLRFLRIGRIDEYGAFMNFRGIVDTFIIGLLSQTLLVGAAYADRKTTPTDLDRQLVVEHAEIVPGSIGSFEMPGYITIWNGTNKTRFLIGVSSDAFETISLYRTVFLGGKAELRAVQDGLYIPRRSELAMKPGGVLLKLSGPDPTLVSNENVGLVLKFSDGTRINIKANVLSPGTPVSDHHHGRNQKESLRRVLPIIE